METDEKNTLGDETLYHVYKTIAGIISRDRYKFEMIVCLATGILFGCVTQTVYGNRGEWSGAVEWYCSGLFPALRAIAPVTLGFVAVIFAAAPFEYFRLLILPASAIRAMGLGALLCGAMQCGSLRELCFASLALLPYAAANCVIAVYAGEYVLGLKESFSRDNEGLTKRLILHTVKMLSFYLLLAALSCVVFAATCLLFGAYLT